MKDYKITLSECKNDHIIENISLKEFENSQKIDLSKIECNNCNEKNKGNSFKNEFFKCIDCQINLCPLCKESHDKNHNIIDYDKTFYICQIHNDSFIKYCKKCKINICMFCEDDHKNHETIYFSTIITNKKYLQTKLNELKSAIDKFDNGLNQIFLILNEVKENFRLYYKIINDLILNYDNRNKNYELLMNVKEIYNNEEIINDLDMINNEEKALNKFNGIIEIYNKIKKAKKWTIEKEKEELIENCRILEKNFEYINKINKDLKEKYEILQKENNELKLNKNDNDNNNEEFEEMKEKLELIGKVIEMGNDKNNICTKYNLGNKFLVTELIHSDFITSEKVINVMLEVDRNDFAPKNPYANRPQYIGYNVTISAPHMHAYALEHLKDYCKEGVNILDVGSGSGFLTVALSKMANDKARVVGIEHIEELYQFGINNVKKNHSKLINNNNIIFVKGDGRLGCKKYGPYKAIHVGAATENIPKELLNQLACNGRMFIPVGKKGETQHIYLVDKDSTGKISYLSILSVCYGMLTDPNSQLNQ